MATKWHRRPPHRAKDGACSFAPGAKPTTQVSSCHVATPLLDGILDPEAQQGSLPGQLAPWAAVDEWLRLSSGGHTLQAGSEGLEPSRLAA